MNAPVLVYQFFLKPETAFADLYVVRLVSDMTTDDGAAYEVEVETGLVTAEAAQIVMA